MKRATDSHAGATGGLVPMTLALSTVLAACQSSPTPDQLSRTATETAPADLQLLCANAAAQQGGVDSSKVLPTNSSKLDARSYRVELNAAGKTMNCIIDTDGNIVSVQPA
jgi:hypothetical protein